MPRIFSLYTEIPHQLLCEFSDHKKVDNTEQNDVNVRKRKRMLLIKR